MDMPNKPRHPVDPGKQLPTPPTKENHGDKKPLNPLPHRKPKSGNK